MFRLIHFLLSLCVLAIVIWFAATVQLGKRTLFGHLRAIAGTKEAKDLVQGTKDAARPIIDKVESHPPDAGRPLERREAHEGPPDAGVRPAEDSKRSRPEHGTKKHPHPKPSAHPPPS